MNAEVQSVVVAVIVGVTVFLLVRGALRKRRKPGCGGDCGCPTEQLKEKLKR